MLLMLAKPVNAVKCPYIISFVGRIYLPPSYHFRQQQRLLVALHLLLEAELSNTKSPPLTAGDRSQFFLYNYNIAELASPASPLPQTMTAIDTAAAAAGWLRSVT